MADPFKNLQAAARRRGMSLRKSDGRRAGEGEFMLVQNNVKIFDCDDLDGVRAELANYPHNGRDAKFGRAVRDGCAEA